eukprot:UN17231
MCNLSLIEHIQIIMFAYVKANDTKVTPTCIVDFTWSI